MAITNRLTKNETNALWHAVEFMKLGIPAMAGMSCTAEQINAEKERLKLARAALRKVNALRKQSL